MCLTLLLQESLDMSESQIERFRRLRQSMLSQINNLTLGESCMMDLVREMLDKVLRLEAPLDVDTKMYLLSKGLPPFPPELFSSTSAYLSESQVKPKYLIQGHEWEKG